MLTPVFWPLCRLKSRTSKNSLNKHHIMQNTASFFVKIYFFKENAMHLVFTVIK